MRLLLVEDTVRLALSLEKGFREEGIDVRTPIGDRRCKKLEDESAKQFRAASLEIVGASVTPRPSSGPGE